MATLTVQEMDKAGITPVFNVAENTGDAFLNNGRTYLHVVNGATDVNVTQTAQTTSTVKPGFGTLTIGNNTVLVADGAQGVFGPFEPSIFNDGTGLCQITYDNEVNVTIAVISLPPPS